MSEPERAEKIRTKKARPSGRFPETLPLIPYRVLRYSVNQAHTAGAAGNFSHRRRILSLRYKCRRLKGTIRKRRGKIRRTLRKTVLISAHTVRQRSARHGASARKRNGEAFSGTMRKYTASAGSNPHEMSILVSESAEPQTGERYVNGETPPSVTRTAVNAPEIRCETHSNGIGFFSIQSKTPETYFFFPAFSFF